MGVAITGIGMMSPLGRSREQNWQQLLSRDHDQPRQPFPNAPQRPSSLCLPDDWIPQQKEVGRLNAIALKVAAEALEDAGWIDRDELHSPRFACVIGTSKGPLEEYHSPGHPLPDRKSLLPFDSIWPSGPLTHVKNYFGITGPSLCPVSACATGLDAVLRGVRLLQQGDCDIVLAGSVDASANPFVLNSYRRLGILASTKYSPQAACKPFDVNRSGFVIGEGGAMFVLMRDDSPWFQPEQCYAHWHAGLSYNDPAGLTQLDLKGTTLKRLLHDLLEKADCPSTRIDLLHLHGTGTPSNDFTEAHAVKSLFGDIEKQPWSTASKGAHGHALGAAGSIELAWLILSLRDGIVPPVANLDQLDSHCPIRPALHSPQQASLKMGLKLSLGFGGHQIGCIISRGNRPSVPA